MTGAAWMGIDWSHQKPILNTRCLTLQRVDGGRRLLKSPSNLSQ